MASPFPGASRSIDKLLQASHARQGVASPGQMGQELGSLEVLEAYKERIGLQRFSLAFSQVFAKFT